MSTTRAEWEQDLGRAADMRPKKLSDKDEQYIHEVMTELIRLRTTATTETEDTETAMATPIQTSDPVTYYPNPNRPGVGGNYPIGPWVTPPTQIVPPRRSRTFTEIYNMGLNLTHIAVEAFEEETGQSISQLTMAQLAVKIAKMLENW